MKSLTEFLTESKHPIFKGLKLPSGKGSEYNHETGEYRFMKKGGYMDSARNAAVGSAKTSGWKSGSINPTGNADGSMMGHDTVFHKGEHVMTIGSSFGNVKSDNWHTITIKKKSK